MATYLMQEFFAPAVKLLERLRVGDIVNQNARFRSSVKRHPKTLKPLLSRRVPDLSRITHEVSGQRWGGGGGGVTPELLIFTFSSLKTQFLLGSEQSAVLRVFFQSFSKFAWRSERGTQYSFLVWDARDPWHPF